MKTQIAAFLFACSASAVSIPPEILDPGNATLTWGNTFSGSVEIDGFILRSHEEQQASLTFFNLFPTDTLDPSAGITIILKPQFSGLANKMSALGLTVGNLEVLSNYHQGIFAGVIGIDSPDTLAFGGSNFLFDVGISGSPVQFALQNYQHLGLDANRFLSDEGIAQGYRLGFNSEPLAPRQVPENGTTALLFLIGLLALTFWQRFSLAQPT